MLWNELSKKNHQGLVYKGVELQLKVCATDFRSLLQIQGGDD